MMGEGETGGGKAKRQEKAWESMNKLTKLLFSRDSALGEQKTFLTTAGHTREGIKRAHKGAENRGRGV